MVNLTKKKETQRAAQPQSSGPGLTHPQSRGSAALSALPQQQPHSRNRPTAGRHLPTTGFSATAKQPTAGEAVQVLEALLRLPDARWELSSSVPAPRGFCSTDKLSCKGLRSVLPPTHTHRWSHLNVPKHGEEKYQVFKEHLH